MVEVPTKPEDFFWESGKSDFKQALQFLIDTRNYVAQLKIPEGRHYMQMAHSDDKKPVGGDKQRPAVLDASYPYFGRHLLSISLPIWTPADQPVTFSKRKMTLREAITKAIWPETQVNLDEYHINTGFTGTNLQEAFLTVLEAYSIKTRAPKIGHSHVEGTVYIETSLENSADFEKGRKIIQAYVHGNAETPEELIQDIQRALPRRQELEFNL